MTDPVYTLTLRHKINLAHCAAQRSWLTEAVNDERYKGEFETMVLWKNHRVYSSSIPGNENYVF